MNPLFVLLFACFSGVSSQCNLVEMSNCLTGFTMPGANSDLQTACESFRQVTSCIQPYKSACAADSTFQSMMSGINMAAGYCSGVTPECDMVRMSNCFRGFTTPTMNSTVDLQTVCKSYRQVTSCIEPYKSACAADSTFQSMMSGINMAAGYCGGDSSCNLMKCYTNAGFNMTNKGIDSPNMNCEVYATVKTCLDGQKSACEGNTLYSTVQDSLQPVEKLCSSTDGSSCGILKCFNDAGINLTNLSDNPREISCGTFRVLEPCLESQRNACQGNQLYTLAESYRPQIKERCRQQLQQGSTDGGTSCLAANWILLFVALLAMAAISQ